MLLEAAPIRRLLAAGGEVHVASEHRSIEEIQALLNLGQRHFAEKYCQEMLAKWRSFHLADAPAHVSFFGHIQGNKVRRLVAQADSIEGIGCGRIAARISAAQQETGRQPRLFMQVNISREIQKNGCQPEEAEGMLYALREDYGLSICGVMIIPQYGVDPLPAFRWARAFADNHQLPHCVMGMSNDYPQAIACGATIVRIGRMIWGK